ITYWTFLIGTFALAGMPPLAGFMSKDRILASAWGAGGGGKVLWIVGLLTAGLTACYMLRAVLLTFHGGFRGSDEERAHLHESPPVMTVPLVVLAVGSVVAGWVGIPRLGHLDLDWFGHFLEAPLAPALTPGHGEAHPPALGTELLLMGLSVAVAATGLWFAWRLWGPGRELEGDASFTRRMPGVRRTLESKYWVDELYGATVVRGTERLASGCARFDLDVIDGLGVHGVRNTTLGLSFLSSLFDLQAVDGLVNAVGAACRAFSRLFRRVQTGWVSQHALTMVAGVLVLGAFCLVLWARASP
ncbi:MAG: proton-conducting transporter membrane subunit, partial [Thermoanaerobaculia bacterium]